VVERGSVVVNAVTDQERDVNVKELWASNIPESGYGPTLVVKLRPEVIEIDLAEFPNGSPDRLEVVFGPVELVDEAV
jgi:hypothetical protein